MFCVHVIRDQNPRLELRPLWVNDWITVWLIVFMGVPLVGVLVLTEGVGNAPTSVIADPVFKTGAASLYLPAFRKWLPGLDSHQHRAV